MSTLLLVALVFIPVFVLVLLSAFTYYDATDIGMKNPRRWALIVLFVPVYGFIIYLLTRSELDYDPETDPYRDGAVNVHPSRADEVPWDVRGRERVSEADSHAESESEAEDRTNSQGGVERY
ncbi:PLD nuclease N-terminal domain-containing protein [Natronosalvus vescus]|uniref:PLD nuclease N-terminal domain-containing protein n=1 Tax=Natronosalvus vescus TaxID=2953881 RepID=UPI0020906964|nr:PLD nuclease N-terminal domain-containing protein [Natronosalvus vescus]